MPKNRKSEAKTFTQPQKRKATTTTMTITITTHSQQTQRAQEEGKKGKSVRTGERESESVNERAHERAQAQHLGMFSSKPVSSTPRVLLRLRLRAAATVLSFLVSAAQQPEDEDEPRRS